MREWATETPGLARLRRPPNVDFQPSLFKHSRHGLPSKFWIYRDSDGPICAVARYDIPNEPKVIVPWIWDDHWHPKHPPAPKPLYGLDRLALLPEDTRILLCEGEKATDAAQRFFKDTRVCMCWMGGVAGVKHADWQPLARRQVDLWPDNDAPGRKAMASIAEELLERGCEVRLIDTAEYPEKWDLADAETEGRTLKELVAYARDHIKDIKPPLPPAKLNGKAPERLQTAPSPGTQVYEPAAPPDSMSAKWEFYGLLKKGSGIPYHSQANVAMVVARRVEDREMDIYYDSFSHRIMDGKEPWTDHQTGAFTTWLQVHLGLGEIKQGTVFDGVMAYAHARRRNPPRDWLEGLNWDGGERTLELLPTGLGTKRTPYTEAVGRCFLVGMVARIARPGCKADCMPVFEGGQGIRKTSMLQVIGGEWFSEVHESMMTKDFYLAIAGKMLCEISELNSMRRSDVERVKGVLSTGTDRFRTPYGRIAADVPRSCVFAGTTNKYDWNTDETGARRFWPVRCGTIDLEWIAENRDQIFAEAFARYTRGEAWWDVPAEAAKFEQEARFDVDAWEPIIGAYLDRVEETQVHTIILDILNLRADGITTANQMRVAKILRRFHFVNKVRRDGDRIERRWVKLAGRKP